MKETFIVITLFYSAIVTGQELYVHSEPASNMPSGSVSARATTHFVTKGQSVENRLMQRYMPELMIGLSKKLMFHTGITLADMHTRRFRWESSYLYSKYRFLSKDDLHSHFRMAGFAGVAYSRSPFHYDDVSLDGDRGGVQAGLIATQLWHKLAISGTISHIQVLDKSRSNKVLYIPSRIYQVMNYSLSAGYLLLPIEYRDYDQTNLNIYAELLAQQSLERKAYYIDLAPAVQLIFNSNTKLNLAYRVQLKGEMRRMSKSSFLISVERTFLNALKKKGNK